MNGADAIQVRLWRGDLRSMKAGIMQHVYNDTGGQKVEEKHFFL